jgi:hypothetical protein
MVKTKNNYKMMKKIMISIIDIKVMMKLSAKIIKIKEFNKKSRLWVKKLLDF